MPIPERRCWGSTSKRPIENRRQSSPDGLFPRRDSEITSVTSPAGCCLPPWPATNAIQASTRLPGRETISALGFAGQYPSAKPPPTERQALASVSMASGISDFVRARTQIWLESALFSAPAVI